MSKPAEQDAVLKEPLASGGSPTLHTIGYGRRTLDQFLAALKAHGIEYVASFNRPNLFLAVQPRRDGLGQTLALTPSRPGGHHLLQHARTGERPRRRTRRARLARVALPCGSRSRRASAQPSSLHPRGRRCDGRNGRVRHGINKSNVRFILHYNLARDVERYYQEIGRAGRDGQPADCLLLHSRADAITIRRFIDEGAASERAGRQARLEAMIRYAETVDCRRGPLLAYFGETYDAPCDHCDNCRTGKRDVEMTDATDAAQKFLTCVERTGECFGSAHLIDVLRGSRSQRVLNRRHDRLPIHGTGREFSVDQWRDLARQFIEQSLVEQDLQFGGLRLAAKGWQVLDGEKVFVRCQPAPQAGDMRDNSRADHDAGLFEQLRRKRRELADLAGVPAYIIFSDRALLEMATHFPRTADQFLATNGVGEAKLANYGETFLQLIRDYCIARGIPDARIDKPGKTETTPWLTARRRLEEVGEAFAAGRSLDELAARFDVKRGTIIQNLQRFCDAGKRLDPDRLLQASGLSTECRDRVLTEFGRLGHDGLGPVYEALGGAVAYEELRLLRLCIKCRK